MKKIPSVTISNYSKKRKVLKERLFIKKEQLSGNKRNKDQKNKKKQKQDKRSMKLRAGFLRR